MAETASGDESRHPEEGDMNQLEDVLVVVMASVIGSVWLGLCLRMVLWVAGLR